MNDTPTPPSDPNPPPTPAPDPWDIPESPKPSAGSKVLDFCIGFFGYLVLIGLMLGFVSGVSNGDAIWVAIALLVVGGIVVGWLAVARDRKYIAMGMATLVVIPLLVLGTCAIML